MGFLDLFRRKINLQSTTVEFTSSHTETATPDLSATQKNKLKEDYATALILWNYGKGNPVPNKYPVYFEYECGITNPKILHENAIRNGLLGPAPYSDILFRYKVSELKTILLSLGLARTGKKQDLIDRIIQCSDESTLNGFIGLDKYYSLTPLGEKFLSQNEDYLCLHKHATWRICLDEYFMTKQTMPNMNFYDIARVIFNKRIAVADSASELYVTFLNLAEMFSITNNQRESLYYYLLTLYVQINALEFYPPYDLYERKIISKKELKENYPVNPFNSKIITEIANRNAIYDPALPENIFEHKIINNLFCDKEIFLQILNDIFYEAVFPFDKWNIYFEKKFYRVVGI